MRTLICGSIAYDTIMVFSGHFKDQILPDQVHILNVAFLVPEMRREFGGCAGNIAYNLKLLGGDAVPMATVGDDAAPYFARLAKVGLDTRHIRQVAGSFTAQAFITTDLADNQITAFHPGAMNFSEQNHVSDAHTTDNPIGLGIVAPDGRSGMVNHAREFAEAGVPFIFDPGQGLPMFDGPDLLALIEQATYVTVNDYEAKLLCDRTGRSPEQLARSLKALIITRGAEGSLIYADNKVLEIPCVTARALADPTGCGDAYRGGLLYGIAQGYDWTTTGRLASTMGSIKIASKGPQNHEPLRAEIAEVFKTAFGSTPW
jgi:adenosine kinase